MARISGVDLPRDKRVEIGLTYVYGIGRPSATKILAAAKYQAKMIPAGNYSGHHITIEKETPCCF